MKKYTYWLMAALMVFSTFSVALANEPDEEAAFLQQVTAIMQDYDSDPEAAEAALAELDAELVGEPQTQTVPSGSPATRSTMPTDYRLMVYALKRGGQSYYHLIWNLNAEEKETDCGSLDYVSIEWDTSRARYYSSRGDNNYSTVRGRSDGIVLFNLQDQDMNAGSLAAGSVQVTPTVAGEMEYGSKFAHTYTVTENVVTSTTQFVSSAAASADPSLGLSYTDSYTVTTSQREYVWYLWDDNAATMHL